MEAKGGRVGFICRGAEKKTDKDSARRRVGA
jgi:hypothetical protein